MVNICIAGTIAETGCLARVDQVKDKSWSGCTLMAPLVKWLITLSEWQILGAFKSSCKAMENKILVKTVIAERKRTRQNGVDCKKTKD